MRIAIYARVSTVGKQHVENQVVVLQEWAMRLGSLESMYVDQASGAKAEREEFKRMMEDARKRKFDVLLIWALDRLSREGIAKLSNHLALLKSYGVRVLSNQESWLDTSGPVADLLVAIFAWIGAFERQRFGERVKAGVQIARAKGKILGRPKSLFDQQQAKELQLLGNSVRKISSLLGVSKTTIHKYLKVDTRTQSVL